MQSNAAESPKKKIFLTGGSGYVGSAVLPLLINAGYDVLALARTEESAAKLRAQGASTVIGDLSQLDLLRESAKQSDGVIHLAFIHNFNDYDNSVRVDIKVINAFIDALEGTGKPLIGTSGTGVVGDTGDKIVDDADAKSRKSAEGLHLRETAERALLDGAARGVRAAVIRLPAFVYGHGGSYFLPMFIESSIKAGVVKYVDDGRWQTTAVHVDDAARAYLLAFEKAQPGAVYHTTGENDVNFKSLAEAVGRTTGLPVESVARSNAEADWGPLLTYFYTMNNRASSSRAEKDLGWKPIAQTNMIKDVLEGSYKVKFGKRSN